MKLNHFINVKKDDGEKKLDYYWMIKDIQSWFVDFLSDRNYLKAFIRFERAVTKR